ncbi:MAG: hypothetical protein EU533_07130 [Promethearchaeota archaeon]|nr:MAG: hypothetical protein EU533_07130 [Candidatus Lokiarchaeota archaeon]
MGSIGILLVYQMWYHRDRLKAKYGQSSYQKVVSAGFGGVVVILSMTIHNYIPYYLWNPVFWAQTPFAMYVTSLTSFFPEIMLILDVIRFSLGWLFLTIAIMTFIRALEVFGFDYMAVIYLYFPEESELQEHKIYSILRHPAYSGILLLSLVGMCFQLTLYSIFNFLILYIGIYIHIHFVEEKELINRFGDSYKVYRKKTPAFFVYPKNIIQFFKFILGKE